MNIILINELLISRFSQFSRTAYSLSFLSSPLLVHFRFPLDFLERNALEDQQPGSRGLKEYETRRRGAADHADPH